MPHYGDWTGCEPEVDEHGTAWDNCAKTGCDDTCLLLSTGCATITGWWGEKQVGQVVLLRYGGREGGNGGETCTPPGVAGIWKQPGVFQHDIDSDRGTCSGPDETVNIIIISFVGERISCEGGQVAPPGQIYEHRGRHMAIVIVLVVTFNLRR